MAVVALADAGDFEQPFYYATRSILVLMTTGSRYNDPALFSGN
jgi:hypothetical protein